MKKKWIKKGSAVLLAVAMVLSLFPGMKGTIQTVQATENTAPTFGYWTDAAGLKEFNLSSLSTSIGKIKFGVSDRIWVICGADGDNLALLSTSEFERKEYGNTSEYSKSNFVNGMDNYLGESYFSEGESGKMADVTVTTNEPDLTSGGNHSVSVENKKLYLPNSKNQESYGQNTIYVGESNDIPIDIKKLTAENSFQTNFFWLRSPDLNHSYAALEAIPGSRVYVNGVDIDSVSVVPAFNLNLLSVIFASAADAASSSYSGYKANSAMTENTYTLRYQSSGNESAVISRNGDSVTVTNASGKYLMVQNHAGVFAMAIDSDNKTVDAGDITMGSALTDFNNCKVWVESTDADRITTAKMATAKAKLTSITAPTGITVANGTAYTDMGLPNHVAIVTEGNTETIAEVAWDTTTPASGSYDPAVLTEQSVTLNGTVTCPSNIDQNNVTLTTTITVTISAAGIVGTPTFAPVEGTYTENQSVTLSSSTDGAAIYYTTDGTTPTTGSHVYNGAIPVTGTAGQSISTTIKAIAVKPGMQDSSVASATYVIEIPAPAPSTYTVTVNHGTGDGSYIAGETVTITADTAPDGQEFDTWTVVSGGVTLASEASATTTFEMPENAVEVTAVYKNKPSDPNPPAPTPTYTITAGAGGTHELSTDETLTITCDGALDKLTGIYVDNKLVDAANYTLKSGSTILTFKAGYLNTLSVGTHKVKFQYSDGSAESTFVIKEASKQNTETQDTTTQDTTTQDTTTQNTTTTGEKDEAPKSGDSTPIAWLVIIAVISGAGVVCFGRKKSGRSL